MLWPLGLKNKNSDMSSTTQENIIDKIHFFSYNRQSKLESVGEAVLSFQFFSRMLAVPVSTNINLKLSTQMSFLSFWIHYSSDFKNIALDFGLQINELPVLYVNKYSQTACSLKRKGFEFIKCNANFSEVRSKSHFGLWKRFFKIQ